MNDYEIDFQDSPEGHRFGVAALLGPPNAGKSTLLNSLLGEKVAIVTPKPQTTRNRISGILSSEDAQIVFLDTPGVHGMSGRMNAAMLRQAWAAAETSDLAVVMMDAAVYARKPGRMDREMEPLLKRLSGSRAPILIAVNKIDLVGDKRELLPVMERASQLIPGAEIFPVSAATGKGLDELLARIKELLPMSPPLYPEDQISTVPLRFMASEIVREKLFLALREELPYSLAVEVEYFEELPDKDLTRIGAVVYVARPGHKAMVIGKGGRLLKEVGRAAREEIADLVGSRVYLELWVKVRERWTEDPGFLRQLGLEE